MEKLTEREIQVLKLYCQGKSRQKIAETLCIELSTVKSHLSNIFNKLQVENRMELFYKSLLHGFIPCPRATCEYSKIEL